MTGTELLKRIPTEDWEATPLSVQRLLLSLLPLVTEAEELRVRLQTIEGRADTHMASLGDVNPTTLNRYHALVDQLFLNGLTDEEQVEMELLGAEIDAENAPFYESALRQMQTVGAQQK